LFNLHIDNIQRTIEFLNNAAKFSRNDNSIRSLEVALGDCSPQAILTEEEVELLSRESNHLAGIEYTFFGANLGHGGGHNSLMKTARSDLILILNPDVLVSPSFFSQIIRSLSQPGVGLVDGRQLPIDHPKHYERGTGETGWASGACLMGTRALFEELHGFDHETFFLHGDDVDISWRARLAGYTIRHNSAAVVFHDKRIGANCLPGATAAERFYSAESGLLLPYKFSRPDITDQRLEYFWASGDDYLRRAAEAFELRRKCGRLPEQIDPSGSVAEFIEGNYSRARFTVG
jgi:GT2 family glycosyltransferase